MIFGYHVNGLPGVPLARVAELIDEAGYGSIALPVGEQFFNPAQAGWHDEVDAFAKVLRERNLSSVVEVEFGGTVQSLISLDTKERRRSIKFCEHAIDVAATLRSDCIVFHSGSFLFDTEEGRKDSPDAAWGRLEDSLLALLDHAEERNIPIGLEPSMGMLVDTTDVFSRLLGRVALGKLRLSLDVATLYQMGETPLAHFLYTWAGRLVNLYLCDVAESAPNRRLMPGEGKIDFQPLFVALDEGGYSGGVHIRFDPPSGDGIEQMQQAMRFLRKAARFIL